jgi:hypothetical protein
MNWQPIETAPTDGYEALVYSPNHGVVCAHMSQTTGKWFAHVTGDAGVTMSDTPTHWMPLPDPPTGAVRAGGVSDLKKGPT